MEELNKLFEEILDAYLRAETERLSEYEPRDSKVFIELQNEVDAYRQKYLKITSTQ